MNCVWPMAAAQEPVKLSGGPLPLFRILKAAMSCSRAYCFLPPGIDECGQRAHDAHRALVLAEIRLHAPDAEKDVAVDAVFLFDGRQQCGLAAFHLLARLDADGRHRLGEIGGGRRGEFRLGLRPASAPPGRAR